MATWISALKAWNEKHGGKYRIPKKGTPEYEEVRALMGGSDKVIMPRKEYEAEHKELVEVLEHGSKKERKQEARKQEAEAIRVLKEVLRAMKK